MNALRHVTYRKLAPWPPLEDFLDKPLGERIRLVRMNLKRKTKGGRIPYLSVDEFAEAVGATSRHRVIGWETKGETPRDYAEIIAKLTPYPAAALGADGEADLLRETYGRRLRSLEDDVRSLRAWVTRGFEALGVAPELRDEAPPPQADAAHPDPQSS